MGFARESFTAQNYSLRQSQPSLDNGPGVRSKGILDEAKGAEGPGSSSGSHGLVEGLGVDPGRSIGVPPPSTVTQWAYSRVARFGNERLPTF